MTGGSQFWIIALLTLLVILTAADLYLDHFTLVQTRQPVEQAQIEEQPVEAETFTPAKEPEPEEKKQEVSTPSPKPPLPSEIKVQVLNGCGVRGIAARVRGILIDRGFDVMSYGNAKRQDYRKSHVIVRSEGIFGQQAAEAVAKSLGVSPDQIIEEIDPSLVDINVTVVLGLDHRQLKL